MKEKQGPRRPPQKETEKEPETKRNSHAAKTCQKEKAPLEGNWSVTVGSFPRSWQNLRNSQLGFKQIDKDEYKKADGRARAKIKIRVYVSRRAKYCECKDKKNTVSQTREHPLTQTHLVVAETS